MPHHEQVMTHSGIMVDAGMVTLLESIWNKGFTTRFSCEGNLDFARYAYIAFQVRDAVESEKLVSVFQQVTHAHVIGFYSLIPAKGKGGVVTDRPVKPQHTIVIETYAMEPDFVIVRFATPLKARIEEAFLNLPV